jgi:predicted metal-dependent HD superfamily phosphohydrolase
MFETVFKAELSNLTSNQILIDKLWTEIASHYSKRNRHYHNLRHLNNLLRELYIIKDKINDWPIIVFSIAYHDIIYNTLKQDNEAKSGNIAYERLGLLDIAPDRKNKCREQILATKGHNRSDDNDTNYFTDADLAILGYDYFSYKKYTEQIRKEYKMYPDLIYKPGRQKVLKHFLQMPTIYKTDYFIERYEEQARNNMMYELNVLEK